MAIFTEQAPNSNIRYLPLDGSLLQRHFYPFAWLLRVIQPPSEEALDIIFDFTEGEMTASLEDLKALRTQFYEQTWQQIAEGFDDLRSEQAVIDYLRDADDIAYLGKVGSKIVFKIPSVDSQYFHAEYEAIRSHFLYRIDH